MFSHFCPPVSSAPLRGLISVQRSDERLSVFLWGSPTAAALSHWQSTHLSRALDASFGQRFAGAAEVQRQQVETRACRDTLAEKRSLKESRTYQCQCVSCPMMGVEKLSEAVGRRMYSLWSFALPFFGCFLALRLGPGDTHSRSAAPSAERLGSQEVRGWLIKPRSQMCVLLRHMHCPLVLGVLELLMDCTTLCLDNV